MVQFEHDWPNHPTPAEEKLLNCFWEAERRAARPSELLSRGFSIRELIGLLPPDCAPWAYTTVATLIRRLELKGYILRVYVPLRKKPHQLSKIRRYRALYDYPHYREHLLSQIHARYPEP